MFFCFFVFLLYILFISCLAAALVAPAAFVVGILQLVGVVVDHADELSQLIEKAAHNWSLARMARMDVLILRLALAEILHLADVPTRVSIDEAVELAKVYSGETSYAFVNGILDAVASGLGVDM